MTMVNDLNQIRDWVQTEICEKLLLKLPDDDNSGGDYTPELVHPTAFALFTPTKDRLPPNVRAPIPSVCIRLKEGVHEQGTNKMHLILNFCTWNPGKHFEFVPVEKPAGIKAYNLQVTSEFKRTADGWQDVFSFVDTALRTLENAEYIAGMRIVMEDGIKYGMTSDKDGIDDFAPYWLAWIELSVEAGNIRDKSYNDFL